VVKRLGVGKLNEHRLARLLGGKPIDVGVTLSDQGGAFHVETTSDNLPTSLQLLYRKLTEPGNEASVFESWKRLELDRLTRRLNSPGDVFQDAIAWAMTGNDPQRAPLRADMLEPLDLVNVRSTWLERFSTFNGATVLIYGGRFSETQTLERMVETYLGSLPGGSSEQRSTTRAAIRPGKLERTIRWGSEPLGRFFVEFTTLEKAWTADDERDLSIFEQFLRERLNTELRERQGKVYSVTVAASLVREPEVRHTLRVSFVCAPENLAELRQSVFGELANLGRSSIDPSHLQVLAAQVRRRRLEQKQSVEWEMSRIERNLRSGDDSAQLDDIEALVARVSAENLRSTARRLFDPQRYVLVVQKPDDSP
jgi:zinc protease